RLGPDRPVWALPHEVVGARGDEVDADRVVAAGGPGDHGLGPDAVGRGHEHRVAVAGRQPDEPAEAADVAHHLGPEGRADLPLDALDRGLARGDVDPGGGVGLAHGRPQAVVPSRAGCTTWPASSTDRSSRTSLRSVTGTSTG